MNGTDVEAIKAFGKARFDCRTHPVVEQGLRPDRRAGMVPPDDMAGKAIILADRDAIDRIDNAIWLPLAQIVSPHQRSRIWPATYR